MRILAIDYGTKRIGMAVCDPLGLTAQPLHTFERKSSCDDLEQIKRVVEEREVTLVVIGLPFNLDGTPGKLWSDVDRFRSRLEHELAIPVEGWDERLTTVQAEKMLVSADVSRRRRKVIRDKIAAALILQSYLDARRQT